MKQEGLSQEGQGSNGRTAGAQGPGADRREMFKKMGRYASYTAPAMLALLLPEKASGGFQPSLPQ